MRWFYSMLFFGLLWLGVSETAYAETNNTLSDLGTSTPNLGPSPLNSLIDLALTLIVIVVLAILTIKFLGRRTQVKQTGSIQILAARQLAPNRFVEVIEVQGKRYLVGVGEQVTLLADVTDDFSELIQTDGVPSNFSTGFAQALDVVRKKYGRDKHGGDKQ